MKQIKEPAYFKITETELQKAADSAGISLEKGKELIEFYFSTLKMFLNDDRLPAVYVPYIGKFAPSLGKINWYLKTSFHYFRSGSLQREALKFRIKRIWPIVNRIKKELNGFSTHNFWRNIPSDWVVKEYPDLYEEMKDVKLHGRV